MSGNKHHKTILLVIPVVLLVCLIAFGSFYSYWNNASPDKTCSSCHEIQKSVYSQAQSSHRNIKCQECHGTALSNGFHSLKEKGMMVFSHIKHNPENVRLNEEQILEAMSNCQRCHTSEYAKWTAGGHSIDYQHVFLNEKHNTTEQINFDCLRCHGMFFQGSVNDIVEPISIYGPWNLKNKKMAETSTIPCMVCHQIHQKGLPQTRPDYSEPRKIFYSKNDTVSGVGFYDRHEKIFFPVSELPRLSLWQGENIVKVSDDPLMRNCFQCHAPNAKHQAGTSDDRTPRGVHEGLSCLACHETHSNDSKKSCSKCHPSVSNCKIDVTKMNTSYANIDSPNNIHFVACADCHKEKNAKYKTLLTTQNN